MAINGPGNIVENRLEADVGGAKIPISVFDIREYCPESNVPLVLIIYGGSVDFSQDILAPMKEAFLRFGFMAAGFNFRGHTEGTEFFQTGLHTRIEDARAVLAKLKEAYPNSPVSVVAVSMGAYVATFLNPNQVRHLILVGPAAYHSDAARLKLKFDPPKIEGPFRRLLRRKESWRNSDAFRNVNGFRPGSVLVIKFSRDDVVPMEVPELYAAANSGKVHEMDYGHNGNFVVSDKVNSIVLSSATWIKYAP